MAIKAVDATQLDSDLLTVANAIRAKAGISDELEFPEEFVSAIAAITTSGGGTGGGIQTASVTPTTRTKSITFVGITAVPDWFVIYANPAETVDAGGNYTYISVAKADGTTIATTVMSGSMGVTTPHIAYENTGISSAINGGLKVTATNTSYFAAGLKYTIVYGNGGSGSGSGGTGGITPSGTTQITAGTTTQNHNVAQYAIAAVSPTPTESKTVTLGANMPSTATPASGKHLSQVSFELDTSVVKASNIVAGVKILGVTGTYTGGGGSSGGNGNIGESVDMTFTSSTPSNAKGRAHYRRATVDTTNLIGFYACPTSKVQRHPEDDTIYHLASVFYITEGGDGVIGYCSTASNDDTQYRTKALSNLSGHVEVIVGDGYVAISTPVTQSGTIYLFCDDYDWTLYPIYSS